MAPRRSLLEHVGTDGAKEVLKELAAGAGEDGGEGVAGDAGRRKVMYEEGTEMPVWAAVVLAGLAPTSCGPTGAGGLCGPACTADAVLDGDADLVSRVRRAAARGATPETVESLVRRVATINTIHDSRRILELADIHIDGLGMREWLRGSRHIAYWVRPTRSRHPEIVGVRWLRDGKPQVFTGRINPP
jgi:hypothetical protein